MRRIQSLSKFPIRACLGMTCAAAVASTATAVAQMPSAPPRPKLKPPVACIELMDAPLIARIDALYVAMAAKWLQLGEHWFQAYELPGEPRNPLQPKADRQGPVRGITWVQQPRCMAAIEPATGAWWVQFTAYRLTFNEGAGWTRPLATGVLAEHVLTAADGGWSVRDNTQAVSFRQPEDKEWRPTAAELPPRTMTRRTTKAGRR